MEDIKGIMMTLAHLCCQGLIRDVEGCRVEVAAVETRVDVSTATGCQGLIGEG